MNPQGEFNHSGGSINQNTYNWLTYLHSKFWIATLELDWTCLDAREVGFWRLCGSLPPLWSLRWCGPWVCVARLLRLCRSLIWSALCSSRKSCKFILIFFSQCRCQNDQPYVDYYLIYHLREFCIFSSFRVWFASSCISMYNLFYYFFYLFISLRCLNMRNKYVSASRTEKFFAQISKLRFC